MLEVQKLLLVTVQPGLQQISGTDAQEVRRIGAVRMAKI